MGNFGGLDNLINQSMMCASLCGVGKHGDNRLLSHPSAVALGAGVSDGSQLFRCRILVESAVCKQERTVIAEFTVRNIHDKETGNKLRAWCCL